MSSSKGMLNLLGRRNVPVSFFSLSVRRSFPGRKHFSSEASSSSGVGNAGGPTAPQPPPPSPDSGEGVPKTTPEGEETIGGEKASISKAMYAYLKRAKQSQELMSKLEKDFVFGRRHLANMMGKDPENFTQKDIDEAIRYLFPSGLYEPRARPMMKPPVEIYPKQKAAQFDASGRPHHPFFYTAKPNYLYLLHAMVGKLNSLNKIAPSVSSADLSEDSDLAGSVWLGKEELENRLIEKITDAMYEEWIACFERIASHPKKDKELEFIKAYRKPLKAQTKADDLPPITLEPDGRKSVHIPLATHKSARGDVLVTIPGTGEFKINGKGLDYFERIQSREAVISPLQLVGWLGKVDVEANCIGGTLNAEHLKAPGESSRAKVVRYGIAQAIAALGADMEKLRLAGYLSHDPRKRERNRPGHDGARAKWTWKKR